MAGYSRRPARALALGLLILHAALVPVAYAETGGGAAASSLRSLGYAFAVTLAMIGGIAYALGRSDVAKSSWMWAIVVAAATAWALSHAGAGGAGGGGGAELVCPPRSVYTDLPVYAVVVGPPGSYTVSWDDGATSVCQIAPGDYYCAVSHVYAKPGNYTIAGAGGSCKVRAVSLGATFEKAVEKALPRDCGSNVFSRDFWECLGTKMVAEGFAKVYGVVLGFVSRVVGSGGARWTGWPWGSSRSRSMSGFTAPPTGLPCSS